MKNMTLVKVFVVTMLVVVGVGFYRGWFVLSSHNSSTGGNQVDVNLTVDPDKMKEDAKTVENNARDLATGAKEKATEEPTEEAVKSEDK